MLFLNRGLIVSGLILMAGLIFQMVLPGSSYAGDEDKRIVRSMSDDVSIRIGGTMQPRMTFSVDGGVNDAGLNDEEETERVGFGLRRLRVRLYTDIGDRLGLFLQMEGSGNAAAFLDIRGEYYLDENLTLRAGRFVGAQPRAYARTSHAQIDAIDRPAISDMWARMTIGADGRDYGIEAMWNTPTYEFKAFLHNGYNGYNFNSGISRYPSTGGIDTEGFAISTSATYWPDGRDKLELGAFASVNTSKNELTEYGNVGRNYVSYSANAYWGPLPGDQPVRVKADFIGIRYQDIEAFGSENYLGGSLFAGFLAADHIEIFAMGELWYGDNGNLDSFSHTFATAGATYSLSALMGRPFFMNRISLAYSLRNHESDHASFDREPAHVVMLQSQFYF